MFKLDDNLLQELGLGALPPAEKNKMLGHIYETLEMRVGMKLAEQMSNEQLDEFEAFIDRNDEPGALKWLETNFPGYKQVVADELERLKAEIKVAAPQIVAASLQEAALGAQQPPVMPTPSQMPPSTEPPQYTPQPQYQPPQPQAQPQPAPQPQSSSVGPQAPYVPQPYAPQNPPAQAYPQTPPAAQPQPIDPSQTQTPPPPAPAAN